MAKQALWKSFGSGWPRKINMQAPSILLADPALLVFTKLMFVFNPLRSQAYPAICVANNKIVAMNPIAEFFMIATSQTVYRLTQHGVAAVHLIAVAALTSSSRS